MKKHYRIEILKCSKCNKRFTSQFIIKNHVSSHLKSHPFSCFDGKCKASFVNLSLLKFHFKKNHYKEEGNCNGDGNDDCYENDRLFESVFSQKFDEKKEEIEGKVKIFQEDYEKFIKKYPIIDVSGMENENDGKDEFKQGKTEEINQEKDNIVLLSNKRKNEEKTENEEKDEKDFTKDEKIILFLLNLFKSNLNSEAFDVLVGSLESYVY